ncbi:MAG TPA: glycoside hydrolase 100 family protein [Flavisolibacter sp.]|jgi:hypothetical protein|nr:glycoside hydrolase 100 family protein [Flavisolibacter sp.]
MKGYHKAIELLHAASTPNGFVAAVQEEDNYRRIWTRDSALCGLAALSTDDDELILTFKRSIETVFRNQHAAGFIPSNVSPIGDNVSYGSVVGRVDNHAWIIISACTYAHLQNDPDWLQSFESGIAKSFALMCAWEFNGKGLMYVPQSADWADEYHHHGYILYSQLLRLWALKCAAKMLAVDEYVAEAYRVQTAIEKYFTGKEFYAPQIERMWKEKNVPYWMMGFNTSRLYTQFDLGANALALLLGVGDEHGQQKTVEYIRQLFHKKLLPSFYPTIEDGDKEMVELKANYALRFRNFPNEFHNGGLWPVWNGFAAMCLSGYDKQLSMQLNESIMEACGQEGWEFNECYHGKTGKGIGVPHCAWSAAGAVLSRNTSLRSKLIL